MKNFFTGGITVLGTLLFIFSTMILAQCSKEESDNWAIKYFQNKDFVVNNISDNQVDGYWEFDNYQVSEYAYPDGKYITTYDFNIYTEEYKENNYRKTDTYLTVFNHHYNYVQTYLVDIVGEGRVIRLVSINESGNNIVLKLK